MVVKVKIFCFQSQIRVSVDGVYLDKNYSTLVPAFFMVGFEGVQRYHNIVEEMERVFQEQNPCKFNFRLRIDHKKQFS